MYNIVKQIGNYGESFERNVGTNTPLKLERGQNALWTNGGLMYAIPFSLIAATGVATSSAASFCCGKRRSR